MAGIPSGPSDSAEYSREPIRELIPRRVTKANPPRPLVGVLAGDVTATGATNKPYTFGYTHHERTSHD